MRLLEIRSGISFVHKEHGYVMDVEHLGRVVTIPISLQTYQALLTLSSKIVDEDYNRDEQQEMVGSLTENSGGPSLSVEETEQVMAAEEYKRAMECPQSPLSDNLSFIQFLDKLESRKVQGVDDILSDSELIHSMKKLKSEDSSEGVDAMDLDESMEQV